MQKRAKNEVFGHFLEFGTSEGLDIVYYDSTMCFSTFDNGLRLCIINLVCIIKHDLCKNEPKMRFLAVFSRLEPQMDLILHIMMV